MVIQFIVSYVARDHVITRILIDSGWTENDQVKK